MTETPGEPKRAWKPNNHVRHKPDNAQGTRQLLRERVNIHLNIHGIQRRRFGTPAPRTLISLETVRGSTLSSFPLPMSPAETLARR